MKEELARLTTEEVITPVTEPTAWVSAMVAVKKKNEKVGICIDPRDLNESIMREHYPLPTFEEVATRLPKARVFSVFDAKTGFWQVKLDEASSYVTTFNTPHGRYGWNRMPFGMTVMTCNTEAEKSSSKLPPPKKKKAERGKSTTDYSHLYPTNGKSSRNGTTFKRNRVL